MADLQPFSETLVRMLDYPLGWLLHLPRDLAVVLLALATAGVLALARARFTNQDLLHRCRRDLLRLKMLRADAKRLGDRAALQRMQSTKGMIQLIRLRADSKVLAVVFVPLALLALWAAERMDFLPVRPGEDIAVEAYFPPSSFGKLATLVPSAAVTLQTSPIQLIAAAPAGEQQGVANWIVRFSPGARQTNLLFRHQYETVSHPVAIDTPFYIPPLQPHPESRIAATEVRLVRYKSLGIIPGIAPLGLAPWMVGYLLLSLLLIPVMRRVFGAA